MKIESLADVSALINHCDNDAIKVRAWLKENHSDYNVSCRHKGDMIIFAYDKQCDSTNRWNWFERNARGLIFNVETAKLVARPFPKFFNWGQNGANTSDAGIESVLIKEDGSLGVVYINENDQLCVATKGSLDSTQAEWATAFIKESYDAEFIKRAIRDHSITPLVEIIYPENRIVVNYDGESKLVLLDVLANETGETFGDQYQSEDEYMMDAVTEFGMRSGFPVVETIHKYETVDDIVRDLDNLSINEEGFIVNFKCGLKAKFKGAEYLSAHRLISHLTLKHVREAMLLNTFDTMVLNLPDEFKAEAIVLQKEITSRVQAFMDELESVIELQSMDKDDQRAFAIKLQSVEGLSAPVRAAMFSIRNKKLGTDEISCFNFFLNALTIRGDE